jgi:large subunit ribosomal protein L24
MKIKKGDKVIVISGKDKGKTGTVAKMLPKEDRVLVEGVNIRKKHRRPRTSGEKGQIVDIALPVHISNVMIFDEKTKKGTRVHFRTEGDKKIRFSTKSAAKIG